MNDRYVMLPIDGYLKQWLEHCFGNPVRFPNRSFENSLLATSLIKKPANRVMNFDEEHQVKISVPVVRGKNWETYNCLSEEGRLALTEDIEYLFRNDLHSLLLTIHLPGIGRRLDEWCAIREIDLQHRDAVKKKFYRIRRAYEQNHIVLGMRYEKKNK